MLCPVTHLCLIVRWHTVSSHNFAEPGARICRQPRVLYQRLSSTSVRPAQVRKRAGAGCSRRGEAFIVLIWRFHGVFMVPPWWWMRSHFFHGEYMRLPWCFLESSFHGVSRGRLGAPMVLPSCFYETFMMLLQCFHGASLVVYALLLLR